MEYSTSKKHYAIFVLVAATAVAILSSIPTAEAAVLPFPSVRKLQQISTCSRPETPCNTDKDCCVLSTCNS
ncbi:hypothetical protein CCACVL1_16173, partial [Corchorus capsularis]